MSTQSKAFLAYGLVVGSRRPLVELEGNLPFLFQTLVLPACMQYSLLCKRKLQFGCEDWQTLTVGIVRFPPSSFPPSSSSPCLPFPSHRCHFTVFPSASFHHSTSLGDGRGWLGGHHLCKGSKMERNGGAGQVIGYEFRQLTNYFVSRSSGSVVCFRKKIMLS